MDGTALKTPKLRELILIAKVFSEQFASIRATSF
jgi:hypothetical protein